MPPTVTPTLPRPSTLQWSALIVGVATFLAVLDAARVMPLLGDRGDR